ncbi:unnamed protein product [Rotaria magnacalcarata]|uniref:Uncharacterized protein n=2 Tax=Rotaria magnacalcarata TaxID=392030 RepID=A0A816S315_9BILA|nr:unnamed protein product [Rotaria magnacalcarata]CAF2085863.1 unnamed protein product [Rotaria magnacalcarata]
MNSTIRSSLVLFLLLIVLINADIVPLDTEYDEQCQSLHCNTSTEICRLNPECDGSQNDLSLKCVYCALKNQSTYFSRQLPLAPRLLAKSGEPKLNTQNGNLKSNSTSKSSSYDEYYEYDDDDTLDKNESVDADDYTNEYAESYDPIMNRSQTIRKSGICPKVVQTNVKCGAEKLIQPDCRFDTDCPGELKCCEAPCGKRVCKSPIKTKVSVCPTSFQCTLNCPLGYRTDSNGCLKCECQSCPSMEQCNKNCPSGYLKDLFGCDVCECNDRCPPFFCTIICPSGVGFAQSENGCPLCQCAISRSKPIEHTSSCQEGVHCPPGFRCLTDAHNVPMCQAEPVADVPIDNTDCQSDLETNCDLQCSSGNYLLDARGCPTCACASNEGRQLTSCPEIKCRANCGDSGYQLDENGCQTCKCAKKENVQCSGVMCRMFCQNGFKRDENGCQYCACNESPQACPLLECSRVCKNGFRKDYSGCQTCDCNYEQEKPKDNCAPVECDLQCKYGFQRDQSACKMCACNRCPTRTCRMFCMYGFRRNEDGCDICECDWTPVSEKIQCSERIPCPDQRVCNMQLRLCEKVDPDSVNWFLYDFEIQSDIFNDHMFVQTFKSGLINNIAMKYGLEPAQISVSSVEQHGLTSFQIMPFYAENIEDFQTKMDQIDADLNSHDFRSVLPGVVQVIDNNDRTRQNKSTFGVFFGKLMHFVRMSTRSLIFMLIFLLIATGFIVFIMRFNACRRRFKHSNRSDSKSPIYDSTYHPAPTEDELYHAIKTDDGATYVAVDTNEKNLSKNKQVYV